MDLKRTCEKCGETKWLPCFDADSVTCQSCVGRAAPPLIRFPEYVMPRSSKRRYRAPANPAMPLDHRIDGDIPWRYEQTFNIPGGDRREITYPPLDEDFDPYWYAEQALLDQEEVYA